MRRLRNKPPKAFCAMEVCFYYVGALSKLNWAMNHPQLIHVHLIIPRCARGGGRVVRYCTTVPTLSLSLPLFNTLFIGTSQTVNLYKISYKTPVKAAYCYEL